MKFGGTEEQQNILRKYRSPRSWYRKLKSQHKLKRHERVDPRVWRRFNRLIHWHYYKIKKIVFKNGDSFMHVMDFYYRPLVAQLTKKELNKENHFLSRIPKDKTWQGGQIEIPFTDNTSQK